MMQDDFYQGEPDTTPAPQQFPNAHASPQSVAGSGGHPHLITVTFTPTVLRHFNAIYAFRRDIPFIEYSASDLFAESCDICMTNLAAKEVLQFALSIAENNKKNLPLNAAFSALARKIQKALEPK